MDRIKLFILITITAIFSILFFNPVFGKTASAASGSGICRGVYASDPIVYGLYLEAANLPIGKNDIRTYIKIVNPALYAHDRYNPFLWKKLYLKDKMRLGKLMNFIKSVRYFKEHIRANISAYNFKKHGFYLTYYRTDNIIKNGMRTRRNINFIKIKNGNIYYLFHNLTIVHKNAGELNFLKMSKKKAENFINGRTGTFGHIKRTVFLEYYFAPLEAKNNILTVKIACIKVYNNKHKNLLIGVIK